MLIHNLSLLVPSFIGLAIALRLLSLWHSRRNEARLRASGAVEFAKGNTKLLAIAHTAYYLLATAEFFYRGRPTTEVTAVGMGLWVLSMLALVMVMRELGELWTVKVFISPHHVLRGGSLYRYFRHPNYVLNIIPELIGFAVALHAWFTLALMLPVYLAILRRRVQEEESAMRSRFQGY